MVFRTRGDILKLAEEVAVKQKGDKATAIHQMIQEYRVMMELDKQPLFQIIEGYRCDKCEGVILEKTHIFSRVTCGGNPVIGCPVCKTLSSASMLGGRKDIISEKYLKDLREVNGRIITVKA